jgi:hypothetical protein
MMVNCVAVAETTSATSSFNFTILLVGSVLKFDPVITIFAPIVSDFGEIAVMMRRWRRRCAVIFFTALYKQANRNKTRESREKEGFDFMHGVSLEGYDQLYVNEETCKLHIDPGT